MSESNVPERTDSSVFVEIHECNEPFDASTILELGRVPVVGEEIFVAPDHCLKVIRVIHLGDNKIQKFPRWAHQKEYSRVGNVAAFVECTTDAFNPSSVLPPDYL